VRLVLLPTMRQRDIAARAGVDVSVLSRLLYGDPRRGHPPTARMAPALADAILGVEPAPLPPPGRKVDATGATRRLRALVVDGHTLTDLANGREGVRKTYQAIANGQRATCSYRVHEMIANLYRDRAGTPGGSELASLRGKRAGWHGSDAWDETTIDDPAAAPFGHLPAGAAYDETNVCHAVAGYMTHGQLAAHRPDLIETVRRLAAQGMSDQDIAVWLRWPGMDTPPASKGRTGRTLAGDAVAHLRKRNGIRAGVPAGRSAKAA